MSGELPQDRFPKCRKKADSACCDFGKRLPARTVKVRAGASAKEIMPSAGMCGWMRSRTCGPIERAACPSLAGLH